VTCLNLVSGNPAGRKWAWKSYLAGVAAAILLLLVPSPAKAQSDGIHVPVVFSDGHDTDPRDRGRPVILIAAALNVPADVFREAFTHVHPAGPGQSPQEAQVRANKAALMAALGPLGVTDDRLNEVSNYYRYSRSRGEMWRNRPAAAYAVVKDGVITAFVVTDGGAGYSSPPTVTVPGVKDVPAKVQLSYGTDFDKNGSVTAIVVPTS
jgi:hypothetical protein